MLYTHVLGILLCVAGSYALYDSSSDVVNLTPSNFDKLVLNSDDVWLVEFFAPWCGHCKSLVPEYKKAATALKGIVKVGAVDADSHKSLGQTYGVSGFPTIKIFRGKKHVPYQGQRTAEKLVDAALQQIKEKAYESLGKKPSSSDKLLKSFGHQIPWREMLQKTSPSTVKKLTKTSPKTVQKLKNTHPKAVQKLTNTSSKPLQKLKNTHPKAVQKLTKASNKTVQKRKKKVKKTTKKPYTSKDIETFNQLQLQLFRSRLLDTKRPKAIKAVIAAINSSITKQFIANQKANEIKNILKRTKRSTVTNRQRSLSVGKLVTLLPK